MRQSTQHLVARRRQAPCSKLTTKVCQHDVCLLMRTEHVEVLLVLLGDYNTKKKWSALGRCGVERADF